MSWGAKQRVRWSEILGRPEFTGEGVTVNQAEILNALLAVPSTGLLIRTDSGFLVRSIQRAGEGLRISNGDGVAGNPSIAVADDLGAIEALTTLGYLKRTGPNVWTLNPTIQWSEISGTPISAVGYGIANGNELDAFAALGDAGGFVEKLADGSYQLTTLAAVATSGAYSDLSGTPTIREALSADRTYYVATTGNDSNDGLTGGTPFLTIQKAISVITGELDIGIYNVTISVADGTYTDTVTLLPWLGSGSVTLQGNTGTPTNCVLSRTGSGNCITAKSGQNRWTVTGFSLTTTAGAGSLVEVTDCYLILGVMNYAAAVAHQIYVGQQGTVFCSQSYTISGSAVTHYVVEQGAQVLAASITITLSGTPAYSLAFCFCRHPSFGFWVGVTFAGTGATGQRYNVSLNGVLDTSGGGATFFPGNVAGASATGGQYV